MERSNYLASILMNTLRTETSSTISSPIISVTESVQNKYQYYQHNQEQQDEQSSPLIKTLIAQDLRANNESNDQQINLNFNDLKGNLLLLFALLVLINFIVIIGNILVILAVYATAKLRNVTNIFTVSLAIADLLLGIFVLPYAVSFEVSFTLLK